MAKKTRSEIHEALATTFQRHLPSGAVLTKAVIEERLGEDADTEWIKSHFSELVDGIQSAVYQRYLDSEFIAGMAAIFETFRARIPENASSEAALRSVSESFRDLDRFFLSISQGRKPRAGSVFEAVIRTLFSQLSYPFTAQAVINGQPDFVLPSETYFRENPMDSIIFTVKRTLRERWRQIISEGTRGLAFFLATIDNGIAKRDLPEMLASRIWLVVPAQLKADKYAGEKNVLTFEEFFSRHLDPAMARWRDSGVIQS